MSGLEFSPSYVPDVTSYDYDAPLTESGQYTAKYNATREMIAAYDPLYATLRLAITLHKSYLMTLSVYFKAPGATRESQANSLFGCNIIGVYPVLEHY